jgi:hypothetical protein
MAALDRTLTRNGPGTAGVRLGTKHSLSPSTAHEPSDNARPCASVSTTETGTNRAPFQRTFDDACGGHSVRGGVTNSVSPWNGKHELSRTAGALARAVASSHSSSIPNCAKACDNAANNASL